MHCLLTTLLNIRIAHQQILVQILTHPIFAFYQRRLIEELGFPF
jgi:hypothetical protein